MTKIFERVTFQEYTHRQNAINTRVEDGIHIPSEYEFDSQKTFKSVCVLGAAALVSTAICPTLFWMWTIPIGMIVLGSLIIGHGLFEGYMQRQYINGKIYRWWLEDTHNEIYKINILVTEWANCVQVDNCISFHNRSLKRFGDRIVGEVHCPWIKKPIAFVEDKDLLRKGFEEFKVRYKQPRLTGRILEMEYCGQEKKRERYSD